MENEPAQTFREALIESFWSSLMVAFLTVILKFGIHHWLSNVNQLTAIADFKDALQFGVLYGILYFSLSMGLWEIARCMPESEESEELVTDKENNHGK